MVERHNRRGDKEERPLRPRDVKEHGEMWGVRGGDRPKYVGDGENGGGPLKVN